MIALPMTYLDCIETTSGEKHTEILSACFDGALSFFKIGLAAAFMSGRWSTAVPDIIETANLPN